MEYTRDEQISIANTIIDQLGGNKFKTMTGARGFCALESGLAFKLPGGGGFCKNGINYVKIRLNSLDTYDVEFWTYRKMIGQKIAEHNGIYDDMLQDIFKSETGLNTHL